MSYTILGKKILNEYIALGVYGTVAAGVYAATRGESKPKTVIPESNATSEDEAAFLKNFIDGLEKDDAAALKH